MDVETKKLVQIDCAWKGSPPFAKRDFNYHHKLVGETRTDIKPLNILQPEGPSFSVSAVPHCHLSYAASVLGFRKCPYRHDRQIAPINALGHAKEDRKLCIIINKPCDTLRKLWVLQTENASCAATA
jgi:hypothetical protein